MADSRTLRVMVPYSPERLSDFTEQFVESSYKEEDSLLTKEDIKVFLLETIKESKDSDWELVSNLEEYKDQMSSQLKRTTVPLWKNLKRVSSILEEIWKENPESLLDIHLKPIESLLKGAIGSSFAQMTLLKANEERADTLEGEVAVFTKEAERESGFVTGRYALEMQKKGIMAGLPPGYVDKILLDKLKVLKYYNKSGDNPNMPTWRLCPIQLEHPKAFLGPDTVKITFHGVPPSILEEVKYAFMDNYRKRYHSKLGYNCLAMFMKDRSVTVWRNNAYYNTHNFYLVPEDATFAEILFEAGSVEVRDNLTKFLREPLTETPKIGQPTLL